MPTETFTHSLPVFVAASGAKASITATLTMTLDERLSLALANQGKVHGFVKNMRIAGIDRVGDDVFVVERAGWYLLQDEKLSYRADVRNDDCRRSIRFNAIVEFRDGSTKNETFNNTSSCNRFDKIRTGFEEVGHSA